MHNDIYQVSTKPITADNFINEDYFDYNDWSDFADYLDDRYEEDETLDVAYSNFPLMGIFERDGDCLTYLGEGDIRKRWMDFINDKMVNEETVTDSMQRFSLRAFIEQPFTHDRFCIEDWAMCPQTSGDFLTYVLKKLKKGDKLYLGGVVDFHY